jgi:hypothetical protein
MREVDPPRRIGWLFPGDRVGADALLTGRELLAFDEYIGIVNQDYAFISHDGILIVADVGDFGHPAFGGLSSR